CRSPHSFPTRRSSDLAVPDHLLKMLEHHPPDLRKVRKACCAERGEFFVVLDEVNRVEVILIYQAHHVRAFCVFSNVMRHDQKTSTGATSSKRRPPISKQCSTAPSSQS